MTKTNAKSSNPILTFRAQAETRELVDEFAAATGVTRAVMLEMLVTEALLARGSQPPKVNMEAKAARKAVMDLKKHLGEAAETALRGWLGRRDS